MTLTLSLLWALGTPVQLAPPDTLTLQAAYSAARDHFPRAVELTASRESLALRSQSLSARWRPALALSGQAVYNSEVASLPFSLPGTEPAGIPNDQYKVAVGLEQLLYDGGRVAAQRAVEQAQSAVTTAEYEVAAYGLREQIERAFFGVLLAEATSASLATLAEDISARLTQARTLVEQGVATEGAVFTLEAEILRVSQQQEIARSQELAARDALSVLSGLPVGEDVGLAVGTLPPVAEGRPESALFAASRDALRSQAELVSRGTRPAIQSFAEAAYGRSPGLNLFEDAFRPFFSVGVRLSWRLWDWGEADRSAAQFRLQEEIVSGREAAFQQQVGASEAAAARAVAQAQTLLRLDQDIIALRRQVADETAVRFAQGVATAADYVVDRNAEYQAQLAARHHEIQLKQSQVRLRTIQGALWENTN